ncbi:polyphosphate kinase 2 [Aeromonas sp. BIGb0445]|nr:polyphosphate kinase 2 [Aeromonas sp. BIGb0445]
MSKATKLGKKEYEKALVNLQAELVKLQEWVKQEGLKVVVLFEGRDAAGKGGVIKAITAQLNPRVVKVAALPAPSDRERTQWYFQRYASHLPAAGEMVLFDRSWYNRAGVERVMGFCEDDEYREFLRACPEFERMLTRAGIIVIKYWFSVSDEEQEKRFLDRIHTPIKRWKFSPMDLHARSRWVEYSRAKDDMFVYTDTEDCPWFVVEADDKRSARINCISHLLSRIPYKAIKYDKITLPPIETQGYERPALAKQSFVPDVAHRLRKGKALKEHKAVKPAKNTAPLEARSAATVPSITAAPTNATPAKKTTSVKPAANAVPAKKTASAKPAANAAPAKKTTSAKPAANAAPAKKTTAVTPAAKAAQAKKTTSAKPAANAVPAKKTAAATPAARTAPAKKTTSEKPAAKAASRPKGVPAELPANAAQATAAEPPQGRGKAADPKL